MNSIAIIPARFASSRLPGKPLIDINGKPMVVRVMEQVQSSGIERIIVATDHQEVAKVVKNAGGEVCLTTQQHQSGTERLLEVINQYGFSEDSVIVNIQVDEPLISPQMIHQVINNLATMEVNMTTLAMPIITIEEAFNPNVVKVVLNMEGYALYFSRATIPWNPEKFSFNNHKKHLSHLLRHIGIYAYHVDFIRRYVSWSVSLLEKIEILEQLRVLWYGEKIYVSVVSVAPSLSVDTPQELQQVRLLHKQS